jgi:multicomponent Na+:H+ antiporter subunit D
MPVKTSLFLVEGLVEQRTGTSRLDRIGGLIEYTPFTAALFGLGALSLAGIPPLSGFVGKFALIRAGIEADQWAIVAVSLAASVLTLFSMVKIWNGIFWGPPIGITDQPTSDASRTQRTAMLTATVACVAITLAVAFAAGPLYRISERAATELLGPTATRPQVLEP